MEDLSRRIGTVMLQAMELYRSGEKYSPRFWRFMKGDLVAKGKTRPPHYSPGSDEEAYLTIGYNDVAWRNSPEAMKMMSAMEKCS